MSKLIYLLKRLLGLIVSPLAPYWRALLTAIGGEHARRRRRAQTLANQIVSELSRLGFTRTMIAGTGKKSRKRRMTVKFEQPLLMTADELWCPLDLAKLPTGVRTDDLRDESVLRSLMDRTDCSVRIDYLANGKLCYVVRHGGAQFPPVFGINKVEIAPDLPALSIPLGVNAEGDQQFVDLDDVVHLLIAGATGGGKTTLQHVALTTLINRNTTDDLELWLIDLKQTEFSLYRALCPKKGGGLVKGIAVEPEDAIDILDRALKEINRRNNLMVQHNATNLTDLAQMGMRLPKVVLFVDEFAQLTLNTSKLGKQSIGKIAENFLTRIAALGRSAGFRIIISTQMVNSAVVSSLIRANFENRIAFSTADWRQSQLVVESSEADGLPKGRCVMRLKGQTIMTQTALISPRQVRIEVERVAQFGPDGAWGEDAELARFVKDAKLLVDLACKNFDGAMARNKMLALPELKGVVGYDRFVEVTQRLERDGVLEPSKAQRPRMVVKAFYNRTALLDNLYGVGDRSPTATPTADPTADVLLGGESAVGSHSDGLEAVSEEHESAVGCGADPLDHPHPTTTTAEEPDPAPPSWWRQIEAPAPVPQAAPKVRSGPRKFRKKAQ